jgi:hypothetical protein
MEKIHPDIDLQYLVDKVFAGIQMDYRNLSYWSIEDLKSTFGNQLIEQGWIVHRGIEDFWGRKPTLPDTQLFDNDPTSQVPSQCHKPLR